MWWRFRHRQPEYAVNDIVLIPDRPDLAPAVILERRYEEIVKTFSYRCFHGDGTTAIWPEDMIRRWPHGSS
jgi:hypothetical protein